jgi:hypothetical protein
MDTKGLGKLALHIHTRRNGVSRPSTTNTTNGKRLIIKGT